MSLYEYKNVYLTKSCKNHCFEKIIDEAIDKNTIEDVKPILNLYHFWYSTVEVKRYSKKLDRHTEKRTGHDISKRWIYCPFCGEKLIER